MTFEIVEEPQGKVTGLKLEMTWTSVVTVSVLLILGVWKLGDIFTLLCSHIHMEWR